MMMVSAMVQTADDGAQVGRAKMDATRPAWSKDTRVPEMALLGEPGRRVVSAMAIPLLGTWWIFWPAIEGRGGGEGGFEDNEGKNRHSGHISQ